MVVAELARSADEAPPVGVAPRGPWHRVRWVLIVAALAYANLWVTGAGGIAATSMIIGSTQAAPQTEMAGVPNFGRVDGMLWRGAAPDRSGYATLARAGVRVVVDLRPAGDRGLRDDGGTERLLADAPGVEVVRIPIRDGAAPTEADVARFLDVMSSATGPVFVHCGAGVGRTGSMVAAYRVATGAATRAEALRDMLAVGPPTLEQLAFVAGLRPGQDHRPGPAMVALSHLIDAPRLIWNRLR
jgi:protein tyrosine phosphatase (PTP) superfamily phosphohydrolase (DUF442 family)